MTCHSLAQPDLRRKAGGTGDIPLFVLAGIIVAAQSDCRNAVACHCGMFIVFVKYGGQRCRKSGYRSSHCAWLLQLEKLQMAVIVSFVMDRDVFANLISDESTATRLIKVFQTEMDNNLRTLNISSVALFASQMITTTNIQLHKWYCLILTQCGFITIFIIIVTM